MAYQMWLVVPERCLLDEGDDLEQLIEQAREAWCEVRGGAQVMHLVSTGEEMGRGQTVCVLVRDWIDPELCHTMYGDGRVETHQCQYVLDDAGVYVRTEVRELPVARQHA